jgi:CheY-like chemotaxis protein
MGSLGAAGQPIGAAGLTVATGVRIHCPDLNGSKETMATPRRVLVVDDNADAAEMLAALFQVSGHQVHVARDGLQALAAALLHRPHLLVLDITLPGLNGLEVCRRIRAEPWGRRIRIAAVTGWAGEEHRRRSCAAGFDAHLAKPVCFAALVPLLQAT